MNFFKKLFGKGLKPTPQSVSQSEASPLSDNFESDIPESLHEACAMGIPSIVRQVLMKPHDVNSRGWASGFTPLHVCISGTDSVDRQEIIKLLHAAGADINIKDTEKGLTPLQYTALRNKPLCMKTLISYGADLNITEANGATALHGAVYHGNLESVKILMEAGADPNKQDNFGNTPLSLAKKTNNTSILALLSSNNFDISNKEKKKHTIGNISSTDIDNIYKKGTDYFIQENFDEALKCFLKINSSNSDYANATLFLTVIYYITQEDDLAIEFYRKLKSMKPDSALGWLFLGRIFRGDQRYNRALQCFVKALEFLPDYSEVWNEIGTIFLSRADTEKSLKCMIKAVTIKTDNIDAWFNLGQIYMDRKNVKEAIIAWQQAAKLGDPEALENLKNLGEKCEFDGSIDYSFALNKINAEENKITIEEINSEINYSEDEEDMTKSEIISKLEELARSNNGQIISTSQKVHFSTIVQLMNKVGAIRHGCKVALGYNGRKCIFDNYTLPNGNSIQAGYPE